MCCAVESLLTAGVEKHVYVLCCGELLTAGVEKHVYVLCCGEFIDSWCREMCVCAVLWRVY